MEFIRFALLGLEAGTLYAVLAQGLVLVYRGSGLLNFAQGAMALVGAYAYYSLVVTLELPIWIAVLLVVAICGGLGAMVQLIILRPMRRSSSVSRVIATIGLTLVIQAAAFLVYGHDPLSVPPVIPGEIVHLFSSELPIGVDVLAIFGLGVVLTIALTIMYRRTAVGRVTTAVAENELAAASLGHSPDVVASLNWALGSALAGLAGVLIAPITFLQPTTFVMLVIPAMAAALISQFSSFSITFVVAIGIGIAQSEISRYVSQPGWATAVPFLAVIPVLLIKGTVLPLRSFVLDRMPAVGTGRVRLAPTAAIYAVAAACVLLADPDWSSALSSTFAIAIICLSIVVITGYAGQISLAQAVLAGTGALIAAKVAPHTTFVGAIVIGVAATGLIGGVITVPALRSRGATLAIATLCMGGALSAVVLSNSNYTGGASGIEVPVPSIFGWDIDPVLYGNRYGFIVLTALLLVSLAVANLRRGRTGRRLLAVRSNERAAAAVGISNMWTKVYAFVLSAGIAGLGGILIAFLQPLVTVSQGDSFSVSACLLLVAVTVVGGVGYVGGAVLGATLVAGGVTSMLFHQWSELNEYLPLIGGVILLVVLRSAPDGMFRMNQDMITGLVGKFRRRSSSRARPEGGPRDLLAEPPSSARQIEPRQLMLTDVSVSFGGVRAVSGVTLEVLPGEIHGLIGPNGAGKTTLVDAISGFVPASSGVIRIGDREVTSSPAQRRVRYGISRSFQSLELFEDLSVLENLAVASEKTRWFRYVTDLLRPGRLRLPAPAVEAARQLDLWKHIDKRPSEVSFGERKTVAIARAVASSPSILLLDEPAAGLDDHEAEELAGLITRIAHDLGVGVLLVEHRMDMIMSICDRVTVLQSGQVIATGTPAEVQEHPAVLSAYLGSDADGVSAPAR